MKLRCDVNGKIRLDQIRLDLQAFSTDQARRDHTSSDDMRRICAKLRGSFARQSPPILASFGFKAHPTSVFEFNHFFLGKYIVFTTVLYSLTV